MFGSLGGPEIILIFVLALLLFGPRKLPEIGRTLGRTLGEFRRATNDFRSTLEREVELEKLKETGTGIRHLGRESADLFRDDLAAPPAVLPGSTDPAPGAPPGGGPRPAPDPSPSYPPEPDAPAAAPAAGPETPGPRG